MVRAMSRSAPDARRPASRHPMKKLTVIRTGPEANTQLNKKERCMQRTASAVWRGGLKDGKGTISTQSGVLKDTQYSFSTRFENGIGTNPEELIAAAHAGCFTMALSAQLGNANLTPESLEKTAEVKFEKTDD